MGRQDEVKRVGVRRARSSESALDSNFITRIADTHLLPHSAISIRISERSRLQMVVCTCSFPMLVMETVWTSLVSFFFFFLAPWGGASRSMSLAARGRPRSLLWFQRLVCDHFERLLSGNS